ncbi:MAG: thiol:disulfide interchange protein DsbA/DsbL [Gammaproteobacteria bacterium]|nr:thiol:disulfide interchange protein DsbA/DsbL [Gammaproteobacteria bacterium]
MMRFMLAALLALCTLGVTAADSFEEGKHYFQVATPLPTQDASKVEVVELFWYGCPHCFHLEPTMAEWEKTKADYINFRRMPAVFSQDWTPHARAFYAAEALGGMDKMHAPLFKALHVENRKIFNEEALLRFAAEQGLDEEDFTAAYTGFAIDGKVKQAMQYTRSAGITGVPAIIVNGKYRVSVQSAGGEKELIEVINFLAAKEHKG